ncbi:hypothetical protein Asi03nite_64010 [Actinoplanes siamensis]|uniref:TrwC relaxase domain-containing protein n=1 Tax=Actinoplanes siamensis TaxID=1223317 RepID=A0A919NCX0_9ACTN|nr:hypothetical protein Asi03nite_64010 [Actinoplanes siamensis]
MIGPDMAQIDYRLKADAGCSLSADDSQVQYRLDASDRPLEWIGEGLREVGIEPGTELGEAEIEAARMLANGRAPVTGTLLVAPKKAIHPDAKLDAGPVVDAVRKAAANAGVTPAQLLGKPRLVARYERLQRGVALAEARAAGDDAGRAAGSGPQRATVGHRAPVGDLDKLAKATDIDLAELYEAGELATARQYKNTRVVVGNRGYDLTLDIPKSYSVLTAMAPPELARQLEDVYLDAVRETVTAMQGWAGYAMRGHHGDGRRAQRVEGTGLLGWMTVHRTARPTPGAAPDPHLHAHVTILNLVRGTDGKWNTVGAGGRDIHRHANAAAAHVRARLRAVTHERWGIEWARDERTGAWEIAAIPAELRQTFSKRSKSVVEQLKADGLDPEQATTGQQKQAAAKSREAKLALGASVDLRADWHHQARAQQVDPDRLTAATMPGPGRPAPDPMPVGDVAAHVFRPEHGLTAHRKVTTRADVLAAVMDAEPGGITGLAEAEQLTDSVLAEPVAVPLPASGPRHLSNADRYTSADIVDAERTVLAAAEDRFAGNVAVLSADTVEQAIGLYEVGAGHQLSAEQRAVITRLATAGHGIDTVVGVAGAGKTTIMSALRTAYEAEGLTVAGAATAAVAAKNLEAGADIESRTVASWLRRIAEGPGLEDVAVLVVDEAAMVDDRHMAALATEAYRTGTKIVAIGDPLQMKAVGVGGTFAAVHEAIGGLSLTENRRQSDVDERAALETWRADQRRAALQRWSATDRVHVTATAQQAHTVMAEQWAQLRQAWPDPHDQIEKLLMLAHTNADVTTLNEHARQARAAAGELGPERTWRLGDGDTLTLAVGDVVMTRTNDRSLGVLNGQRGVVTALDERGRVQIERRDDGPDGPETVRAWVDAGYVEHGGVQLAYAITAAKAQGLTTDRTLVYGNGMDAHVLYPAMSRDRHRVDLWLALYPLETDADRARLGTPRTEGEARQRAIDAYAAALERDLPDRLVLTELGEAPQPDPEALGWRRFHETLAELDRGVARLRENIAGGDQAAAAGQAREPVRDVDALAARVAALTDDQVRRMSPRDELRERLRRIPLTPEQRAAAADQTRREVMAELQAIAAGEPASGRYTRAQLVDGLAIVRAEITAQQQARATQRQAAQQRAARNVADRVAADRAAAQRAVTEPEAAAEESGRRAAQLARQAFPPLRQRTGAEDGPQQLTPDGATGPLPWWQRAHGRVPTAQLGARIGEAERTATVRAARAEQWDRQAEQLAEQLATGTSPAVQALHEQREQLQQRAAAADRADRERATEQQLRQQVYAAYREATRLEQEAATRNRLMLRLSGTPRRQLQEQAEQQREHARAMAEQADQHQRAAYQADREAADPTPGYHRSPPARQALAELTRDWEQRLAGAADRDYGTVARYRQHAEADRAAAERATASAAGMRAEAGYRAGLDPVTARQEDNARNHDAELQARAQRQAAVDAGRRAAAERRYDYDHHHTIDHGPELSL